MGNSWFTDKVQDIIHKAGKAFIVKSEVRKITKVINQLISRKSNLNSIIQNMKAAQSATFDLLILELMFLFFKNTVKN